MPKLSTTKITKRIVDALEPGNTIWDSDFRGFGVRCQVIDRSYILKCSINKKRHFITIGKHGSPWTVETARAEARRISLALHRGESLSPELSATVEELADRYLKEYAPRKKSSSQRSDKQLIKNHIKPLLGKKCVRTVCKAEIGAFHDEVRRGSTAPADPKAQQLKQRGGQPVRGGPGVANRCLTLLSKMFNLAEDWRLRNENSNPIGRIKRFPEAGRERFLSSDELTRLGRALCNSKENTFALAAIRLLILTGARSGEILSLKWEWVDLTNGLLLLPDSKTGKKAIRLSRPAVAVLQTLPRYKGNPYVIVGQKSKQHLVNLQKPWRRLCQSASISGARIHDLRHTFASCAVREGVPLAVVGALLVHASTQTTERYAHMQKDHVSAASETVGTAIASLINPTSDTHQVSKPKKIA